MTWSSREAEIANIRRMLVITRSELLVCSEGNKPSADDARRLTEMCAEIEQAVDSLSSRSTVAAAAQIGDLLELTRQSRALGNQVDVLVRLID